ncbi:MAG: type II toxin-antitoxin system ParD family antitoxin [Acidobacteriaceae bacterium]
MPTRNVSLTLELNSFVEKKVQSGQYDNASEVIRDAIRALQQAEAEDKAKVAALRRAISEGLEGPGMDGPKVMAAMRERIRSRAAEKKGKAQVA